MRNKKYTVTAKNGGCVPSMPIIGEDEYGHEIYDERVATVQIPCGRCKECLDNRARNWQIRLAEEIPLTQYNYFITLTFAPEELGTLCRKTRLGEVNPLMGVAIRRMLERWRKDHKKSLKHWFITELGHEGTERIHAHGLILSNQPLEFEKIEQKKDGWLCKWKYWRYGNVFVGDWVNNQTINYLMKYVCKIDNDHKHFIGYVFTSPGIGKKWLETMQEIYKYRPHESLDYYRMPDGHKVKLPTYYKNHRYTEEEREMIWRDIMDKDETIIAGNKYYSGQLDMPTEGRIRAKAQEINKKLGYGSDSQEWRNIPHCVTEAMLRKGTWKNPYQEQEKKDHNRTISQLAKDRRLKTKERLRMARVAEKQRIWDQKERKKKQKQVREMWLQFMKEKTAIMATAEEKYKSERKKMYNLRRKMQKNLQVQNNITTFATENDVKYDTEL